jgi:uncharacterized membrane protein (DUF485 family)
MSDGTTPTGRAEPGTQDSHSDPVDWTRIERSPEFRELTSRRHRFIAAATAVTFGVFAIYLGLATFATGFMGTTVGGVPIAWLAAMSQVVLTWAVTWTYLRNPARECAPLAGRVAETAGPRFTREHDAEAGVEAGARAPAASTPTERSAR